jgi:hypothetical protein
MLLLRKESTTMQTRTVRSYTKKRILYQDFLCCIQLESFRLVTCDVIPCCHVNDKHGVTHNENYH